MEQIDLVRRVIEVVESLELQYMVVGSYGSGAWGEPRFTYDLDVVIRLTPRRIDELLRAFPFPEYYLSPEAVQEAVAKGGQFNLIHPESGSKVDFILPGRDEWGSTQLGRRKRIELRPGLSANVGAPEDIILSKMLYYQEGGSEKHLRDITGILKVSGELVDRAYVSDWAGRLGVTEVWEAILRRLGERG